MKECSVSAFVRVSRWVACAAVALSVGAATLAAQATGKIEGRVRDQAGAPVASAQIRINGTAFGAVANSQGYYFINNVPAGSYEIVATFVGYKPVGVSGLKVPSGQTVTQDFTLEQTPIVINEIMYNPISGNSDDEFIELYNPTATNVNIGGWFLSNSGSDARLPMGHPRHRASL